MLMVFLLAEAASTPPVPPPVATEKCVVVAEYSVAPTVTGFGTSSAANEQSQTVSRIVGPKTEVPPDAEGRLPEKAEPKAEPAVQSPKCGEQQPAGVPKRRKNERLG